MSGYLLKLIGAFFGSMGFGYLFHVRNRNLIIGSIGGVIGIVIYRALLKKPKKIKKIKRI